MRTKQEMWRKWSVVYNAWAKKQITTQECLDVIKYLNANTVIGGIH